MYFRTLFESNLVDEYLRLVYQTYILTQPGILANYYNFDPDNSEIDTKELSSYGTPGGELSGLRFKLIHNLYLPFANRVTKQQSDTQEKGINAYDTSFQIFLPTVYGIMPYRDDKIAFRPNPQGDIQVFEIAGIEEATVSNNPNHFGYYLTLKPIYLKEDEIKISQELAFDQTTFKVVDINTYNKRLLLFMIAKVVNDIHRKHYNHILNTFLDKYQQKYIGFENLIAYTRPLVSQYFKDITWMYFTNVDSSFMDKWNQFLENKDVSILGLDPQITQVDLSLIDNDDYTTIDTNNLSLLDSFIITYKLNQWIKEAYA